MELQITDETLKANLTAAILASIGEAGQKAIITDAIERLTVPAVVKNRWGKPDGTYGQSTLQDLFEYAVRTHATKVIAKLIKDDAEVREQIERLVRDSLLEMLKQDDTGIALAMASAFTTALQKARDY